MATNDEIRAKDIIPHKTAFSEGDGFYGDGDNSFFMEASKLLELTAQNALAYSVTDFVADKMKSYAAFVRECYLPNASSGTDYAIDNIARGKNGHWYVSINNNTYYGQATSESSLVSLTGNSGWLVVDWSVFPSGQQAAVDIPLSNLCLDKNNSPTIVRLTETDETLNGMDASIHSLELIYDNSAAPTPGFVYSNYTSGEPREYSQGQVIPLQSGGSSHFYARVRVAAGQTIFVPYVSYSSYSYAYPVLVSINNEYVATIDTRLLDTETILGGTYKKCTMPSSGWLIVCFNGSNFKIYSANPTRKASLPHTLNDSQKDAVLGYIGVSSNSFAKKANYFDYDVALKMNPSLLREMIESSSNGKCTVIYDSNGYPSLMRKIPITSIGALDSRLGDDATPHPAFVVNGAQKKHIYAGVFLNSTYNNVPVSWWGNCSLMRSKTIEQCKTACSGKGTGWHLETIWERSLISLMTMRLQDNAKPLCNNDRGRSQTKKYLCAESEGSSNIIPGQWSNGQPWVNGTQPIEWSHDLTQWGLFDIIGGYHEFVDLVKSVDGKIYLADDNNYGLSETDWTDTGAWVTYDGDKLTMSNAKNVETLSDIYTYWTDVTCSSGYDTLSESTRKKLSLALLSPRLNSSDSQPLWNFDGKWVLKNGLTTYQFMGGAEEYGSSGLGTNYFNYGNTEAHNNMGSRLFYIE